jgi:opacity protein-like surface antigen
MKARALWFVAIGFLLFGFRADAGEFSIAPAGSYTTSTRFLYDVGLPDFSSSDRYFSLNFGLGVDIRYNLNFNDVYLGISAEEIRAIESSFNALRTNGELYFVPYQEGYIVYPIEVSGYFILPFSTDFFKVYVGGGVGEYFGERMYSVAGVTAPTINSPSGFGIHVSAGTDIRLAPFIAIRAEMKFRDPQFDSENKFEQSKVQYEDISIKLDQTPTTTRINLNGITYCVGFVFTL